MRKALSCILLAKGWMGFVTEKDLSGNFGSSW